ncbi:MAG: phosphotransferase [Calditrichaeota bacterium]|nr:phosphotransferase [Calditrichota bacterium]
MNEAQTSWLQERFPYNKIERLPIFGSVRKFYRLYGTQDNTRVVVLDEDKNQFRLFIDRAKLFASLDVKVPQVFDYSEELNLVIEQDLGDESLEVIINKNDTTDRLSYYRKVIDILVGWQKRFDNSPELQNKHVLPEYDIEFAYNESALFINRYLKRCTDNSCTWTASLKPHFVDLAMKASSIRKTLMHRDFQARNIMWHCGEPYFVDFQACMMGPYTYDIAALVYDNHVDLSDDEKQNMIDYFYSFYPDCDREDFYAAALQRTLQAISAYAYLSRQQGKTQYEQYIPVGLKHLKELEEMFNIKL